jgi:hypothetical protein
MKWAALAIGAAVLALGIGAGASALVDRAGTRNVDPAGVAEPSAAATLPATSTAALLRPAAAAAPKKLGPPPRDAARLCKNTASDESDRTGDDSSGLSDSKDCATRDENEPDENENESEAGEEGGDERGDQAGDEQAGENDNGD